MNARLSLLVLLLVFLLPAHAFAALSAKDVESAFAEGQSAFKEGRLDDAADAFSRAAQVLAALKQPDKARAVYGNVAVIRMQQERWSEAGAVYTLALALPGKPDPAFHLKAVGNMAFCAEKAGRHEEKAEIIASFLAARPKLSQADLLNFLAMLGDAYRASERYALACGAYEKALALKNVPPDTRVRLQTGLGLAQGNLGRYPKALASLFAARDGAESLEQEEGIVEATSNIGVIYWEMGQYEKAAQTLQLALERARKGNLRRNEGVDSNNLGLVYKSAGRLGDAGLAIDAALEIAREVGNERDEAIALGNRALILRMRGDNRAARDSYMQAMELYRKTGFSEGEASALMGLAKMDRVVDKDYKAALDKLTRAAHLYEELENPGFLAEACVQLGQLYQKIATPGRTTRDLVFDADEPEGLTLTPAEALEQSAAWYARARELADSSGRKEMLWSALHGQGFVEREQGRLETALERYIQAIDVVLSMKGTEESADLLLEFLRDKDALFAEAIDVCSRLYAQTRDPALLRRQMEYDEIYRNEVLRAHARLASLSYTDPEKRALYDEIAQLTSSKKKAEAAARRAAQAQSPADKAEKNLADKESTLAAKEFEAKLKLWKSRYPNDAVLFDSVADINFDALRAGLAPDQAVIQYIPLENSLIILTVTSEELALTSVEVSYAALAALIRDEFIAVSIEGFGHSSAKKLPSGEENLCYNNEGPCYAKMQDQLHQLYGHLYEPVAERLRDKSRLYIVTSKYLSYVPFAGLVVEKRETGLPRFLVEDKTITLSRLSFMQRSLGARPLPEAGIGNMIAVGDPRHEALEVALARLEGAAAEVDQVARTVRETAPKATVTVMTGEEATKSAWIRHITETPYSLFYFATHGVPYAEIKHDSGKIRSRVQRTLEKGGDTLNRKPIAQYQNFLSFYDANFPNNSHLNGFLFMAYPDGAQNGLLRLKDIQELPESVFRDASLAVLSACNTAVSYSPKVVADESVREDLESGEAARELADAGWTPGVDQVCLVDTFMKQNFRNVYGTLWFADDTASSILMAQFMQHLPAMHPAQALREAQLHYLRHLPQELGDYPMHPYFWACGNIFGQ